MNNFQSSERDEILVTNNFLFFFWNTTQINFLSQTASHLKQEKIMTESKTVVFHSFMLSTFLISCDSFMKPFVQNICWKTTDTCAYKNIFHCIRNKLS